MRNYKGQFGTPLPDLDVMPLEQLERTYNKMRVLRSVEMSAALFPSRPMQYVIAGTLIYRMIHIRRKYLTAKSDHRRKVLTAMFEAQYARLPEWAQWRRRLNVAAAVVPGKKFRKKPPKPKM